MSAPAQMQEELLYALLKKMGRGSLTEERVCRAILSRDTQQLHRIGQLEALGHTMLTALRFRDYHRAARYLIVFEKLCRAQEK